EDLGDLARLPPLEEDLAEERERALALVRGEARDERPEAPLDRREHVRRASPRGIETAGPEEARLALEAPLDLVVGASGLGVFPLLLELLPEEERPEALPRLGVALLEERERAPALLVGEGSRVARAALLAATDEPERGASARLARDTGETCRLLVGD